MPTPRPDDLVRHVCHLVHPGACAALAFDGFGHELGNGWFEITRRINDAPSDAWLPAQVGDGDGTELLHDLDRPLLGRLRAGDIMRKLLPGGWVHALHDGECWVHVDRVVVSTSDSLYAAHVRSLDQGGRTAD